eukprot:gene2750-4158_t
MPLLKYETKGPTVIHARWGLPDKRDIDVTSSFVDHFKNNHESYVLYDHDPNIFNDLEGDPLPNIVKVLTVVYCSEGSKKKKCQTLYEHESNTFPSEDLESDFTDDDCIEKPLEIIEEEVPTKKKKSKKPIHFAPKKKVMPKKPTVDLFLSDDDDIFL